MGSGRSILNHHYDCPSSAGNTTWNEVCSDPVWSSQDIFHLEDTMAQEYRPGEIVPQSGVYRITHDPVHADMPHEVTVIKGRRFPTCRHCKGIGFQLAHAAKHVSEVEHLKEPEVAPM
jgi:hypothetical protein